MRRLALVVLASLTAVPRAYADGDKPEPLSGDGGAPVNQPAGSGSSGSDGDGGTSVNQADGSDTPDEPEATPLHEDNEFGPLIMIEAIVITGNTATQTEIIRRALPIAPGDILHASDRRLRDARFKVLGLGYFRDVTLAMRKGSERGQVVIEIHVVERGTFVLNRMWFGTTDLTPYWFGADVGERNLLGLGLQVGVGVIYAGTSDVVGSRDQWAGELRLADGALGGSRWGAYGSMTLVHGSEAYRTGGGFEDTAAKDFAAFPYRRFGGRAGFTYDVTSLSRISAGVRLEEISDQLPTAPTQTLPTGEVIPVDLHLLPGQSRVSTLAFGFDRDTRPDPVLPHAGGRITVNAELGSAAFGSDYDFATLFASYEHWWPLFNEHQTIGIHIAGGLVVGDAPRFDRIYVSDVDHLLTPRALGLVLSDAAPLDILGTRADKPTYGEVGGNAIVEYAARLFRGSGKNRVYGGDAFVAAGIWGLAETADLRVRDGGLWSSLPIDIYADAGVRIDTDIGIFELTIGNALGRLR